MQFSVNLPTEKVDFGDEFIAGSAIAEMARCIEGAGFDACFVTDHPMPGDRWLRGGGHHTLDPFVALSFAAAATERLRLQTHVLVLPYRNPFLTAKAAASLDFASGGRVILGVAPGYLEIEFEALGADFEHRNEDTDEAIRAMRRAWQEDDLKLEGRRFHARGNTMLPRPKQSPHPPIWIGGNSRRAIRRAVELGDGWLPFPAPKSLAQHIRTASIASIDDLAERIAYAREHARAVGRKRPLDICFVPFGFEAFRGGAVDLGAFRATLETLGEQGVTWATLNVTAGSRKEYCAKVEDFGAQVLDKIR